MPARVLLSLREEERGREPRRVVPRQIMASCQLCELALASGIWHLVFVSGMWYIWHMSYSYSHIDMAIDMWMSMWLWMWMWIWIWALKYEHGRAT